MLTIVSLFDESGNALRPWAEAGHECHAFDIVNTPRSEDGIYFHRADLSSPFVLQSILGLCPNLVMSFPPCTDLAVSGAGHFAKKREANPHFQTEASQLAQTAAWFGAEQDVPWMAENPVSVLATMWRKPDFYFHPWEYGGYLPDDDIHPRWPDYIAPRDAYPKKTGIWCGNGFTQPKKKPVDVPAGYSKQHTKLGGKSAKTKQIRSETPRGFAQAVFETMEPLLIKKAEQQ